MSDMNSNTPTTTVPRSSRNIQSKTSQSPTPQQTSNKFKPPISTTGECLFPDRNASRIAFVCTSIGARTALKNCPAWWCKVDGLVVLDGVKAQKDDDMTFETRTSKGLSIARRRGDLETVIIPLDCVHCQSMLRRKDWRYSMRVCKRGVCGECKERCVWEHEQEEKRQEKARMGTGNRERADSMLQDDEAQDLDLMQKVGIEQEQRVDMCDIVGIQERLEELR